jgi:hypothetical protein
MSNIQEFENNGISFTAVADDVERELATSEEGDKETTLKDDGLKDSKDAFNDDPEDDSDEDETQEDDEGEDDAEEEEEDDDDGDKEKAEVEPEAKIHVATLPDGSQVDLPDTTTIKIKVDGKFQRISIKDLKTDFNGKVKHSELIRQASESNKTLESKLQSIESENTRVKNLTKSFLEGVTKGDFFEAMGVIAEMTNEDVQETIQAAIEGLTAAIEDISGLSPEQVQDRANRYKLDVELRKKQAKLSKYEEQDAVKAAIEQKKQYCEKLGLEESQMNEAYHALAKRNANLEAEGKKSINFTMDDIAVLAMEYQTYDGFLSVADEHEIELSKEDINYLMDLAKAEERKNGSRLNEKDYVRLISTYANKQIEKLDRKVGATTAKTTPKKKKKVEEREIARTSQIWDI